MEFHTAIADRVLHLALFVVAAIALVMIILAVLERTLEREPKDGARSIRIVHVVVPAAATVAVAIAERLYHVFA